MAVYYHPHSQALSQCFNDIIQNVTFEDIALKLFQKDLITIEEYEELSELDNQEAVEKVIEKLIRSNYHDYEKFLEVLAQMDMPQYTQLENKIWLECERARSELEIVPNIQIEIVPALSVSVHSALMVSHSLSDDGDIDTRSVEVIIPEPIVGRTFTEYLIQLCRLFLKAIDDRSVRLTKDGEEHKRYVTNEMKGSITILEGIMAKFHNVCIQHDDNDDEQQQEEDDLLQYALVPILVVRACRIVDTIRQPFWVWSSSNMDTLLSLCDGMVQVVKGTRQLDTRSFCDMIGYIQQLRTRLDNAGAMLQRIYNSQIALSVMLGSGAAICFILGAALTLTPAAAVTIPLLVAGGVLTWQTLVQTGLVIVTSK